MTLRKRLKIILYPYDDHLLKTTAIILVTLILSVTSSGQYYLRGEVHDEDGNPLSNAKILLQSTGYVYYSGNTGSFGILSANTRDSITVTLDGYNIASVLLDAAKYEAITLKMLRGATVVNKMGLLSFTKDLKPEDRQNWPLSGETYSSLIENDFLVSRKYPETGFAIHSDKASYSNIRRFLNMGTTVPPDAVRPEELLNYFNFDYKSPPPDSLFGFQSYVSDCPWNASNRLLFLQISAKKIDPDKIPASNLVFLIDISGSMDMPNRLPLLKSSFKLLVDNLREKDTISIVVYGSTVGVWLPPTSGKEKKKIRRAIEELEPGGATPGASGILSAYRLAKSQYIAGGNNRVILATDGDFNVGQSSDEELEKMITQHRQSGIYLTCLGVGMGNYKDSKLEILAKQGNGNFSYLDNEKEGEKVLVRELTQTLYTVADDASLSVLFNPRLVKSYRLIGYDNKVKAFADSLNEVEGGEVGSGNSVMVLFEVVPALLQTGPTSSQNLASVKVNYKLPDSSRKLSSFFYCPDDYTAFDELPDCYRFSSSVVLFASLLRNSKFTKHSGWNDVLSIANNSYDKSDYLQKEFLQLVEKAKKIYGRKRKKLW